MAVDLSAHETGLGRGRLQSPVGNECTRRLDLLVEVGPGLEVFLAATRGICVCPHEHQILHLGNVARLLQPAPGGERGQCHRVATARCQPAAAPPPDEVIDRLRTTRQARIGNTRARLDQSPGTEPPAATERELRNELIAAEHAELSRLYDARTISAATRRRLQRGLDLETARLTEGQH